MKMRWKRYVVGVEVRSEVNRPATGSGRESKTFSKQIEVKLKTRWPKRMFDHVAVASWRWGGAVHTVQTATTCAVKVNFGINWRERCINGQIKVMGRAVKKKHEKEWNLRLLRSGLYIHKGYCSSNKPLSCVVAHGVNRFLYTKRNIQTRQRTHRSSDVQEGNSTSNCLNF